MIAVTVAARAFGYIREAVVAQAFGVSREVDLFLAAMTVPAVLISTAYHSIPNAFVPLGVSGRGPRALPAVVGVTVSGVIVAILTAWLAAPLIETLASGFDPELQRRASSLLRLASVAVVLAVIEALLRSRLLAQKQFGLPGLSYVWQGMGIVVAVLGWPQHGAMAMTWGLVLGAAGSVAWNAALLARGRADRGIRLPASVANQTGRVWIWVSIVLMTDSLAQFYSVIDRHYGSFLQPGAIAALHYANLIGSLPSAIIGIALSTALLPFLSDAASEQDDARATSIVDRTVRWSLLLTIPATIWMITFRGEIVGILFQRGAFDIAARDMTSPALAASALGIVPAALAAVWSRLFYASRNWLPIGSVAVIALTAKFFLTGWLSSRLDLVGLALATSCASATAATAIVLIQGNRLTEGIRHWAGLGAKVIILVGAPAFFFRQIMNTLDSRWLYARAGLACIGGLAGILLLIMIGKRWGIPQMADIARWRGRSWF